MFRSQTEKFSHASPNQADPPRTGINFRVKGFRSMSSKSGDGWFAWRPRSQKSHGLHDSSWAVRWVPYVSPMIPTINEPGMSVAPAAMAMFGENALIPTQIHEVSHLIGPDHAILVATIALQGVFVFSLSLSRMSSTAPKIQCEGTRAPIPPISPIRGGKFRNRGRIGGD